MEGVVFIIKQIRLSCSNMFGGKKDFFVVVAASENQNGTPERA
jgi:hypothetical protein